MTGSRKDIEPSRQEREAVAWVVRHNAGKLSREDAFAFEDWLNEDAHNRKRFKDAARLWVQIGDYEPDNLPASTDGISLRRAVVAWFKASPVRASRITVATCLSAALIATAIGFGAANWTPTKQLSEYYAETAIGENQVVELSDGSTFQLNTNSKARAQYTNDARVVSLLRGEAHFSVEPDPKRPFRVYTTAGLVEAVGTSFSVQLKNGAIDVFVTDGTVKLSRTEKTLSGNEADEPRAPSGETTVALVDAGKNAVLKEEEFLVRDIDRAAIQKKLSWTNGVLLFDGDTLETALAEFQRYTDVELRIADGKIRSRKIVGYFNAGDTDKFLEALHSSFEIQYEKRADGSVYLTEAGG